jgi:hypothetical protein
MRRLQEEAAACDIPTTATLNDPVGWLAKGPVADMYVRSRASQHSCVKTRADILHCTAKEVKAASPTLAARASCWNASGTLDITSCRLRRCLEWGDLECGEQRGKKETGTPLAG